MSESLPTLEQKIAIRISLIEEQIAHLNGYRSITHSDVIFYLTYLGHHPEIADRQQKALDAVFTRIGSPTVRTLYHSLLDDIARLNSHHGG